MLLVILGFVVGFILILPILSLFEIQSLPSEHNSSIPKINKLRYEKFKQLRSPSVKYICEVCKDEIEVKYARTICKKCSDHNTWHNIWIDGSQCSEHRFE